MNERRAVSETMLNPSDAHKPVAHASKEAAGR